MPGPKVYDNAKFGLNVKKRKNADVDMHLQSLWWGDKSGINQRGIVQYTLSPFRQRPVHHMVRHWMFNGYRRLSKQVPYWIVPFAIGYGTYTWANNQYAWQMSKAGHLASGGHH
ncbi:hypothetical protein EWM64_g2916 [Hericium alpestre]|uniref:Cytochrome b-c1 complex subunit 8 n=1 Tax=Hericium alpestre TaxID=135208 RepID=A0A4Z0A3R8_9AGAM|nr:hypothetical protein EWM64_g2916 [Hericium alpestre]